MNIAATVISPVGFDLRRFLPARLTALSNRLRRRSACLYRDRFKLSAPEWLTLAALGQRGTMSVNAVIAESAMDKIRVSRAVAKLLNSGLITRESDPQDRRRAILGLTAKGRDLFGEIVPLVQGIEAEMIADLSAAERKALDGALAKIESFLAQADTPAEQAEAADLRQAQPQRSRRLASAPAHPSPEISHPPLHQRIKERGRSQQERRHKYP